MRYTHPFLYLITSNLQPISGEEDIPKLDACRRGVPFFAGQRKEPKKGRPSLAPAARGFPPFL
ncbi:MAG: hypothetical protein AB1568_12205, partial [Thermodesulfobacteriota bacterium]